MSALDKFALDSSDRIAKLRAEYDMSPASLDARYALQTHTAISHAQAISGGPNVRSQIASR